ncbi:Uncharacterised protein [Mycobacteroides abscessus]|nr:Uncharacterised protein [Mycobacteroides abscessus]CQA12643.1 Uncharacterised protein [Mycobacteroides abscessus]
MSSISGVFSSTRAASRSASLAASISSDLPVLVHVTMYALLSIGPTEALMMVAPSTVRRATPEPGSTWPE